MQYLSNNLGMVFIAVFSGLLLLWSFFGNRIRGIKDVDTVGAINLINHQNALVLDVREDSEFKAGHMLNAKWLPLGQIHERTKELEKYRDKPIVVVCRSGQRSSTACSFLNKQGYTQVYNLVGGVSGWQKANLPLEK